jgi:hypothetical protein
MVYCPVCDGPGYLLGVLGSLVWCRCRNCGWDFNVPADELLEGEPEEGLYPTR